MTQIIKNGRLCPDALKKIDHSKLPAGLKSDLLSALRKSQDGKRLSRDDLMAVGAARRLSGVKADNDMPGVGGQTAGDDVLDKLRAVQQTLAGVKR